MSDDPARPGDAPGDVPAGPPAAGPTLDELVGRADLDGLLRHIETLCTDADWAELLRLRDRCRAADATGRQLWPAAAHAEYRLALQADPAFAAPIAEEAQGRFAIGPLTEVVASTHDWASLAPHLSRGPTRALIAYERVLRGEDLRRDRSIDRTVFDLPLRIEPWEPAYPVAGYEPWRGIFTPPRPTRDLRPVALPFEDPQLVADPMTTEALAELTRPWTEDSNGRGDAAAVMGDALDAIAALGVPQARVGRIGADHALEIMAAGRFNAWWTVAALLELTDDWPVEPDELGLALERLAFFAWDTDEVDVGWSFRLAVVDVERGLAWAAMANDQRLE
jgi:hypothetical protein